jgi:hypothetical protein
MHWHHVRTTAAANGFVGMIGGWHWRGRSALAADWCILPPSPGGEASLLKDHRTLRKVGGMETRRFIAAP